MRIILKKSLVVLGRKRSVGTVMVVTNERGVDLLSSGFAEGYTGEFPPKGKVKWDLKQLKA